jgi:hypothetical protein
MRPTGHVDIAAAGLNADIDAHQFFNRLPAQSVSDRSAPAEF